MRAQQVVVQCPAMAVHVSPGIHWLCRFGEAAKVGCGEFQGHVYTGYQTLPDGNLVVEGEDGYVLISIESLLEAASAALYAAPAQEV